MHRFAIVFVCLLVGLPFTAAQTLTAGPTTSDVQAVTLAQQSLAALAKSTSVADVTLNANVVSIVGSDDETGTGTFSAKGLSESRVVLNLTNGTRSDVRSLSSGIPAGAWQKNSGNMNAYAQHNCWTDAAWFFPVLSSLSETANSNFVFKYIGQEIHNGLSTQHIQVYQPGPLQALTTTDFYLDPNTFLPLAAAFSVHPDNEAATNIAIEIRFANYRTVSGILVPFHFQRLLNGGVSLDVEVTSVALNSGLQDSLFTLQ